MKKYRQDPEINNYVNHLEYNYNQHQQGVQPNHSIPQTKRKNVKSKQSQAKNSTKLKFKTKSKSKTDPIKQIIAKQKAKQNYLQSSDSKNSFNPENSQNKTDSIPRSTPILVSKLPDPPGLYIQLDSAIKLRDNPQFASFYQSLNSQIHSKTAKYLPKIKPEEFDPDLSFLNDSSSLSKTNNQKMITKQDFQSYLKQTNQSFGDFKFRELITYQQLTEKRLETTGLNTSDLERYKYKSTKELKYLQKEFKTLKQVSGPIRSYHGQQYVGLLTEAEVFLDLTEFLSKELKKQVKAINSQDYAMSIITRYSTLSPTKHGFDIFTTLPSRHLASNRPFIHVDDGKTRNDLDLSLKIDSVNAKLGTAIQMDLDFITKSKEMLPRFENIYNNITLSIEKDHAESDLKEAMDYFYFQIYREIQVSRLLNYMAFNGQIPPIVVFKTKRGNLLQPNLQSFSITKGILRDHFGQNYKISQISKTSKLKSESISRSNSQSESLPYSQFKIIEIRDTFPKIHSDQRFDRELLAKLQLDHYEKQTRIDLSDIDIDVNENLLGRDFELRVYKKSNQKNTNTKANTNNNYFFTTTPSPNKEIFLPLVIPY